MTREEVPPGLGRGGLERPRVDAGTAGAVDEDDGHDGGRHQRAQSEPKRSRV